MADPRRDQPASGIDPEWVAQDAKRAEKDKQPISVLQSTVEEYSGGLGLIAKAHFLVKQPIG